MVNWIISSSVLILTIILLRYLFKGKISLRLQYGLWLLAAIRLLVPANFGTSSLSVENLTAKAIAQPQVQNVIALTEQVIPVTSYERAYEEVIRRYEEEGRFAQGLGAEELEAMEYEAHALVEEISLGELAQKAAVIIWAVGVVVMGAVFFLSNAAFGKRLKNNRRTFKTGKTKLPVYVSDVVETPCLFGIFKPGIYITETVAENDTLLRYSVLHEQSHYAHGDLYWSIIRCLCLALHWYNPLVWKAAILSKQDAELACDEATLGKLGEEERVRYGETLLQLTCEKRQDFFVAATTMTSGKKSIKERIILIARKPKVKKYALILVTAAAMLAVGCTFTDGANSEQEEENLFDGMYTISVRVADGRDLVVALDMEQLSGEYYQVNQIFVYDGEELLQTIKPTDISGVENYAWDGLFVNKGYDVGEPDIRDLNFDGAEDFGLLAVEAYPKNVPYSYFLWNQAENRFDYSFTLFGSVELEVDTVAQKLIEHSHDTMGTYEAYYEYTKAGEFVESTGGLALYEEPEKDKVCLAIMPDGISKAGGDYRFIIPEDQVTWMDGYKEMKSYAVPLDKKQNARSQGIWIVYNDEWTELTEYGFILQLQSSVVRKEAKRFWNLCVEEAAKYGAGEPLRPEAISEITSATLYYEGTYTVTDEKLLDRLEKSLSASKELRGGGACPFTATLVLERGDTWKQIIYLATDSCTVWLSDGVYYTYSDFEDIEDLKRIFQKAAGES